MSSKQSELIHSAVSNQNNKMGAGNHARCYSHPTDKNKVLLATNCMAREAMSKGIFMNTPYFPQVKKVGTIGGTPIYEMEKLIHIYDHNKHLLSKRDFKLYQEFKISGWNNGIRKSKLIPKELKAKVIHAYTTLKRLYGEQYREIQYDIAHTNIMMTRKGQLVLNDIFWVA